MLQILKRSMLSVRLCC